MGTKLPTDSIGVENGLAEALTDDSALLEILLKHLPTDAGTQAIMWHTTIMDAADGSGDGILTLPNELLAQVGWKEGDTLTITKADSGDLILRRAPE